jgi:cytochrome b561
MQWRNSTERYGSLSIGLHWFMLLLLVAVYACIELRGFFPRGSEPREALKTWHTMLGLSVFVFVWLRLLSNTIGHFPPIEPEPPRWQTLSGRLMHVVLYALMIFMPLAGWLMLSAEGKPIPFFGLHLPALISESKSAAELIKEIHVTAGTVGYFLIGLHALAALFHHYVMRDNTLWRMLPFRSGSRPALANPHPAVAQKTSSVGASVTETSNKEQPVNEHEPVPGLSTATAAERLKSEGYNELPSTRKSGIFKIIFDVAKEPMFLLTILFLLLHPQLRRHLLL